MKQITRIINSDNGELITKFELLYKTKRNKIIRINIPTIQDFWFSFLVVEILPDEINLRLNTITRTIRVYNQDFR